MTPPLHIRWMVRRDMPEVFAIENESFDHPWNVWDFADALRQRNCIGMVAERPDDDRIAGYMIYALHKHRLALWNIAVAPDCRRRGIGTQMLATLIGKLSPKRRTRIELEVRETNYPAQVFFRQAGFRAVAVLRGWYKETDEDAYVMVYRLRDEGSAEWRPENRISQHVA